MNSRTVPSFKIQEIVVDLFGSLVPGAIFLAGAIASLVWWGVTSMSLPFVLSGWLSIPDFYANTLDVTGQAEAIARIGASVSAMRVELAILFLFAAYVFGHLFHRQDIKLPDKLSLARTLTEQSADTWVARNLREGEFPYQNLKQYFASRELVHLRDMVRWDGFSEEQPSPEEKAGLFPIGLVYGRVVEEGCGPTPYLRLVNRRSSHRMLRRLPVYIGRDAADGKSMKWKDTRSEAAAEGHRGSARTKNFINALKLRIAILHPEHYAIVARHEAHVRLNSSSWYMARTLAQLCRVLIVVSLVGLAIQMMIGVMNLPEGATFTQRAEALALRWRWLVPAVLPLGILLLCRWMMYRIEKVLHYQRVRELVCVMDAASVLFRHNPELIRHEWQPDGLGHERTGGAPVPGS